MTALASRRSIMTLYADATDPVGHGVRIVLAEKDINVEVSFVNHETKPEDLNDLNPYHEILTLIDRDLVLYDPQIMLEYLDERYPHPPLMPVDPASRASNRQLRYRISRDLYGAFEDIRRDDAAAAANARRVIRDNLMAIVPIFARHAYFLSEEFSLVDCWVAPLLWRLERYGIKLSPQAKPLMRYADMLFAREAFKACLSPFEKTLRN